MVNTKKEFVADESSAHSLKERLTFDFENTKIMLTESNGKKNVYFQKCDIPIKKNIKNALNRRTNRKPEQLQHND